MESLAPKRAAPAGLAHDQLAIEQDVTGMHSIVFLQAAGRVAGVQAFAAVLWIVYGALIHEVPVVVANLIVAGVAVLSSFAPRFTRGRQECLRHIR